MRIKEGMHRYYCTILKLEGDKPRKNPFPAKGLEDFSTNQPEGRSMRPLTTDVRSGYPRF